MCWSSYSTKCVFRGSQQTRRKTEAAECGNIGEISRTGVACSFEVPPNRFGVGLSEEVPARTPNLLRRVWVLLMLMLMMSVWFVCLVVSHESWILHLTGGPTEEEQLVIWEVLSGSKSSCLK